jgi:hypothetical protein
LVVAAMMTSLPGALSSACMGSDGRLLVSIARCQLSDVG